MATENPNIGNGTLDFGIEFRATEDDAWYDVILFFHGKTLTVKYVNFSDECKEIYHSECFKTIKEMEDFKSRFRMRGVQLQDHECIKVIKGKVVCASYFFNNDEIKFYDAIVDDVLSRKHSFAKGEEECFCSFVLFWQHGPLQGTKTFANIASICLTPSTMHIDPALISFLKIARQRIITAMKKSNLYVVECEGSSPEEPDSFNVISKPIKMLEPFFMKLRKQRRFRCAARTSKGRLNGRCKKIEQSYEFGCSNCNRQPYLTSIHALIF